MYSTGDTAHPVYTTPTALDGTYSVTGITSGSYLVRFTGDPDLFIDAWYPERKIPPTPVRSRSTRATRTPATTRRSLTPRRHSAEPWMGPTTSHWARLASTSVCYAAANTTTPITTTTSAADGSYRLAGMAQGVVLPALLRGSHRRRTSVVPQPERSRGSSPDLHRHGPSRRAADRCGPLGDARHLAGRSGPRPRRVHPDCRGRRGALPRVRHRYSGCHHHNRSRRQLSIRANGTGHLRTPRFTGPFAVSASVGRRNGHVQAGRPDPGQSGHPPLGPEHDSRRRL